MRTTLSHGTARRGAAARVALILVAGVALAGCEAPLGGLRGLIASQAKPQLDAVWTLAETSPTERLYVSFDGPIPQRDVGLDPLVPYVTDAAIASEQVQATESLPMALSGPDGDVAGVFTYYVGTDAEDDAGYMTFEPLEPLASSTFYALDVVYADTVIEFRTTDRPYVTGVSPHPGLWQMPYQSLDLPESVSADTVFEITFSEDVNVTTVTPDAIRLRSIGDAGNVAISTNVGYDGLSRTATVDPVDSEMTANGYELTIGHASNPIETADGRELHGVTFYFDK